MGPVWRNEKPGPGRYRQFYQCDADTVGAASVAADAEICAMLADALEAVGISRGDYVVRVNNRKVLNGVMEVAGILDPANPDAYEEERGIVLRAIDKLDRLGSEGVRALLGAGRKDESGDFTKGAGLNGEQIAIIMKFADATSELEKKLEGISRRDYVRGRDAEGALRALRKKPLAGQIDFLSGEVDDLIDQKRLNGEWIDFFNEDLRLQGQPGPSELFDIIDLCFRQGYGPDRIIIDPSVVRGLGYYTGPVFEAELTFEILDEKGRKRQFGSVAGGGRYDGLVERFTGQKVPATGVSIGVDRLLAALREKGRLGGAAQGPVIVTVMDRDRMADYMAMANDLRRAGIRAEVYLGNPKQFGNQLKYADKRASPIAVIQGDDEAARGVVVLKDLALGARIAAEASLAEWKAQPAQTEVPRENLVAAVLAMLGRG
jgi:histidyl-tRNA synthetase